jgi:hypothetical protein
VEGLTYRSIWGRQAARPCWPQGSPELARRAFHRPGRAWDLKM